MSLDYKDCLASLYRIAANIDRGATEVMDTVGESTALWASTQVNRRKPSNSLKDNILWVPTGQSRGRVVANKKYAKWVEYGRGPVVAREGKVLRFVINGVVFYRKRVGPAEARPFMRTARNRALILIENSMEAMVAAAITRS